MRNLYLLLIPRILRVRAFLTRSTPKARRRALIMGCVGLAFWVGMFVLSCRVLIYFQSVEVIGDLLAHHLLSVILLTFFLPSYLQPYHNWSVQPLPFQ